jgi:hypothetical protein
MPGCTPLGPPVRSRFRVACLSGTNATRGFPNRLMSRRCAAIHSAKIHTAPTAASNTPSSRQLNLGEGWRVEQDDRELKNELGLDHFEGRSRPGFHHLALLTVAFVFWRRFPCYGLRGMRRAETDGKHCSCSGFALHGEFCGMRVRNPFRNR